MSSPEQDHEELGQQQPGRLAAGRDASRPRLALLNISLRVASTTEELTEILTLPRTAFHITIAPRPCAAAS